MLQRLAKRFVRCSAEQGAFFSAQHSERTVEVVGDQHDTRIIDAGIKRVVPAVAGHETCFLVAKQIVNREMARPVFEIHVERQRFRNLVAVRLAKRLEKPNQIGVVVLPAVGLLRVKILCCVGCRLVAEIF